MELIHQLKADIEKFNATKKNPLLNFAAAQLAVAAAVLGTPSLNKIEAQKSTIEELVQRASYLMLSNQTTHNAVANANIKAAYTKLCDYDSTLTKSNKAGPVSENHGNTNPEVKVHHAKTTLPKEQVPSGAKTPDPVSNSNDSANTGSPKKETDTVPLTLKEIEDGADAADKAESNKNLNSGKDTKTKE